MNCVEMKLLLPILVLTMSCGVIDHFKRTPFEYEESGKKQHLVFQLPRAYTEQKSVLDPQGGKEQFYYYDFGALLYIAKDVSWLTENQPFIEKSNQERARSGRFTYKGTDANGLHWKEIRIEGFRFGYSYVPAQQLHRFEHALNSIRFR